MKVYRVQNSVVEGKEIFVGLEDSKKTWKIAVRGERMLIHQYAIRAARLKLHPHLTIPPIRPAGGTRSRIIKESAAPALIGCTHQHQLNKSGVGN